MARGFAALRQLKSLQEFLFLNRNENENTHLLQHISLCFKLLPNLHAVAFKIKPWSNFRDIQLWRTLVEQALSKIRRPCTLLAQLNHFQSNVFFYSAKFTLRGYIGYIQQ
jgi:hypothetical protein